MSQASPSHVAATERHRRQVAGFIADDGHARFVEGMHDGQPAFRGIANELAAMSPRWSFDVHDVRAAAESMLRESIEVEQVFADWTRALGLGPENREPGTFGCRTVRPFVVRTHAWRLQDRPRRHPGLIRSHSIRRRHVDRHRHRSGHQCRP